MKKVTVAYPQLTFIVTDTKSKMVATGCIFKEKVMDAGGKHLGMHALITSLSL